MARRVDKHEHIEYCEALAFPVAFLLDQSGYNTQNNSCDGNYGVEISHGDLSLWVTITGHEMLMVKV